MSRKGSTVSRDELLKHFLMAKHVSSMTYRGYRISTVSYREGDWHVYIDGPGIDGEHDHGYATRKQARDAAKNAIDHAIALSQSAATAAGSV